jgi:formate dehydrogenase maturation protein FdhE
MAERLHEPVDQEKHRPRCPSCGAFPTHMDTILNSPTGQIVRLYRCECGERIWQNERF